MSREGYNLRIHLTIHLYKVDWSIQMFFQSFMWIVLQQFRFTKLILRQ